MERRDYGFAVRQKIAVLMVIDMQGNLYESMQDKEFLQENVRKLIRGMQVFGIPVIVTEQIPEKLGPTIEPVASLLTGVPRIPKADFSCCGDGKIMKALKAAIADRFFFAASRPTSVFTRRRSTCWGSAMTFTSLPMPYPRERS